MIGFLCRGEFYSRAARCRLPFARSFIPCRIKPAAFIDRDLRDRTAALSSINGARIVLTGRALRG